MGTSHGRGFPEGGVFNAALDAVVVMSHEGLITDFNPAAERTFGHRRDDVLGRELAEVIVPSALRGGHREAVARYLATGKAQILDKPLELFALRSDGTEFPVELTITRVPDHEPPLFAGFVRDISARQRADAEHAELLARERLARAEAEAARERYQFFADAGLAFDHALDLDDALSTLAGLAVPALADLCIVDYVGENHRLLPAVAVSATDASLADRIREERRAGGADIVALRVLRSGQPELIPDARAGHPELDCESAIVVALRARDRLLGTVTLARMDPLRRYGSDDFAMARELARRAGLAVDNARLYEDTRHIAAALQASLLPPVLPRIPVARLAGRYRAARPGQELGGDFYDVFPIDRGRWVIAIGDVCGKGPEAAALTALARYTIRAAAATGEGSPDGVLSVLNEALLRDPTAGGRFLTAACAILEPEGGVHSLCIASGGHPAPLVVREGGEVEWVRSAGSVLGVFSDPALDVVSTELRDGDALVLYTDGLTDAGAPARTLGEDEIAAAASTARHSGAGALVDALETAALRAAGGEARDDIALLALQNTPERRRRSRPDSRPLIRVV